MSVSLCYSCCAVQRCPVMMTRWRRDEMKLVIFLSNLQLFQGLTSSEFTSPLAYQISYQCHLCKLTEPAYACIQFYVAYPHERSIHNHTGVLQESLHIHSIIRFLFDLYSTYVHYVQWRQKQILKLQR